MNIKPNVDKPMLRNVKILNDNKNIAIFFFTTGPQLSID